MDNNQLIQLITILISLASTFLACIALVLLWWQLRYQNKQMHFAAMTQLHQEIIGPTIQRAIRYIYSKQPQDLAESLSEEELEKVELVLNTYDLIGHKVRKGVLPEQSTLETEWPVLLRLSQKLGPFIVQERQRRGEVPYKANFEWLVIRAESLRKKKFPQCQPQIFVRSFPRNALEGATAAPEVITASSSTNALLAKQPNSQPADGQQ
jgi:hypothetical protein